MDNFVGKTIGGYTLSDLVQAGGVGAIFKARSLALQRDVALKVFNPRYTQSSQFQEQFYEQARGLSDLSHPNIVRVLDFGESDKLFYVVMEFIPGPTLRQKLDNLGAAGEWLSKNEAVHLVGQLCLGIHYLGQKGFPQRDINPDHIILKPHTNPELPFQPVLIDLGLSRLVGDSEATQPDVEISSPAYMSPEQALGKPSDGRSDIYSLGVLLYELVIGRLPHPISNFSEAVRFHAEDSPPLEIPPETPPEIAAVIQMSLTRDPEHRFNSADAMAKALAHTQATPPTQRLDDIAQKDFGTILLPEEESTPVEHAPTQLAQPPELPPEPKPDRILVLMEDQTIETVDMKPTGLTIGRKRDTDIVLEHPMVSREHTRIEFDGQNYQVTDLNSSNGTFIGDTKITPGVPTIWPPNELVGVGDFKLKLDLSGQPVAQTLMLDEPVIKKTEQIPALEIQDPVKIFIDTPAFTVEPGNQVIVPVVLLNQGPGEDYFAIDVQGVPPEWMPASVEPIPVQPGVQAQVNLVISPPQQSSAQAGDYSVTVQARSQTYPSQVEAETIVVTVTPFSQFASSLRSERIRAGRKAELIIENTGNTPDRYDISWRDLAPELVFEPPDTQVEVPPGQKVAVPFRVRARSRNFFGGSERLAYYAQVGSSTAGSQKHNGEVISGAVIPLWVLPVLAIIFLLAIVGGGGPFIQNRTATTQATQTAKVAITATALANLGLDTDGDTITDVDEAKLGTDSRNPDTDGDGLKDNEELNLGTSPVQADTDADGLLDGDEQLRGTNPFAIDSDGDTLPDGMEVNQLGTSPISRDTDGDGLNDNVDLEPNSQTTPEVVASETSAPEPPAEGEWTPCPGLYNSRLHVDDLAMVTEDPPVPNRVRQTPNTDADILFFVFPGGEVKIIGGPECGNGFVWWQIRDKETNRVGWTSEGDANDYWLIPVP